MKERIKWLDVLKFIGIIEIYYGHFSKAIGTSISFVFAHHVHLFFFAAGCSAAISSDKKLLDNLKSKIISLLIPFYFFSALSFIVFAFVKRNIGIQAVVPYLKVLAMGNIRNKFFAASLWFISCIFVISILFPIVKKLKNKYLIFSLCLISYIITRGYMTPSPSSIPRWFFNIDSALYYIVFYAVGYLSFPTINKLLNSKDGKSKAIVYITGALSAIFAVLVYIGKNPLNHRALLYRNLIPSFFTPLIIIWFWVCVSYHIRNISLFSDIGKKTLYLCGNEYLVKTSLPLLVSLMGVRINVNNKLSALLYSVFLILICYRYVIPYQERFINRITSKFHLNNSV